jgi:mRNA interferase RelE/StbE
MWRVEFTAKAAKQFSKLDNQTQQAISHYLDRVLEAGDPTSFGKGLVGEFSGFWRYRVGKYRLICELQKNILLIEVISIGKRDKVYG